MFKRGMDSHGQLSVEYLLLLVVILVVFGFMITHFIGPSIDASNDISDVSAASNAANSIANAANVVYANGIFSKRTVAFNSPGNMTITTGQNNNNLGYITSSVPLSNGSTKVINVTANYKFRSDTYTLSKGTHTAMIVWEGATWRMVCYIT